MTAHNTLEYVFPYSLVWSKRYNHTATQEIREKHRLRCKLTPKGAFPAPKRVRCPPPKVAPKKVQTCTPKGKVCPKYLAQLHSLSFAETKGFGQIETLGRQLYGRGEAQLFLSAYKRAVAGKTLRLFLADVAITTRKIVTQIKYCQRRTLRGCVLMGASNELVPFEKNIF
ncbi:hypothetical protein GWK47_040846 [Chionoecetes opilio]|uniref:Uncharacterized protein n=1 Tax=Chionoecetes opilio TaxID=41210 RepID=A0A8J5D0R3_CHIOP|nr:hypothetical protein GWK47_040846 [Chionoecetes opilio]